MASSFICNNEERCGMMIQNLKKLYDFYVLDSAKDNDLFEKCIDGYILDLIINMYRKLDYIFGSKCELVSQIQSNAFNSFDSIDGKYFLLSKCIFKYYIKIILDKS